MVAGPSVIACIVTAGGNCVCEIEPMMVGLILKADRSPSLLKNLEF